MVFSIRNFPSHGYKCGITANPRLFRLDYYSPWMRSLSGSNEGRTSGITVKAVHWLWTAFFRFPGKDSRCQHSTSNNQLKRIPSENWGLNVVCWVLSRKIAQGSFEPAGLPYLPLKAPKTTNLGDKPPWFFKSFNLRNTQIVTPFRPALPTSKSTDQAKVKLTVRKFWSDHHKQCKR